MKRLYLLRHAKSDWGEPGLRDHERPLAPRGKRAAPLVARYMTENDLRPEAVLVSSATRARETLGYFDDVVKGADVRVEPRIYGADVGELMELLKETPEGIASVLLVGHNPTIQDLTLTLAAEGSSMDAVRTKFPTAGLAILDADVEGWAQLGPTTSALVNFVTPKELG